MEMIGLPRLKYIQNQYECTFTLYASTPITSHQVMPLSCSAESCSAIPIHLGPNNAALVSVLKTKPDQTWRELPLCLDGCPATSPFLVILNSRWKGHSREGTPEPKNSPFSSELFSHRAANLEVWCSFQCMKTSCQMDSSQIGSRSLWNLTAKYI